MRHQLGVLKCSLFSSSNFGFRNAGGTTDARSSPPPPPAPTSHRESRTYAQTSNNQSNGAVEATIKDIRMTLQRTKTLPLRPLCVTNGDNEDPESSASTKSETPIWVPRLVIDICLGSCRYSSIRPRNFKNTFDQITRRDRGKV